MPNKKNRPASQPQKGPGVVNISENSTRNMPPIYRQDSRSSDHGGHFQQSKPKSNYDRTKEDYRSAPKAPSPFPGVSHLQSPQRPERNTTQSAWGAPKPASAWGASGNAWGSSGSAQSQGGDDDDWIESVGFVETPVSRPVQVAPPPKENVWQQRMEFYHGAMPGSEAEEERMFQAALELSRLQDEEEQLRIKMEEEDRLAEMAKTSAKNQSLYAYNEASSFHMPAQQTRQTSPPSWAAPSPSWPVAPPERESNTTEDIVTSDTFVVKSKSSPWGTSLSAEESHQPRPQGFRRGVGRGSTQSSRSVSVSSDTNSEACLGQVKSPKRPEPKIPVVQDVWDSGSDCDDNCDEDSSNDPPTAAVPDVVIKPAITNSSDAAPKQSWMVETAVSAQPQHNNPVGQQEPVAESLTNNISTGIAREAKGPFSSNQSDANIPNTVASVPHTSSKPAQPVPLKMNGLPSESALAFGRGVVRRQYGPRARAQRTTPVNSLPVTTREPPNQKPSVSANYYTEDNTTEKLRNLCDRKVGVQDDRSEIPKKNNIFSNLEPAVEKVDEGANTSCDNHKMSVPNTLAGSLPVFPSAVPLDLRKNTALPTPSNSGTENDVQDMRTQLGGLALGGGIWSQHLINPGNIPNIWGQAKPEAPRLSRSSSDASDSVPTSSPGPSDILETQNANTHVSNSVGNVSNDIGSYLGGYSHPYMNMQMPMYPQMYGMGYQGLPMAHGLGLSGLAMPGAAMPTTGGSRPSESQSPGLQQNAGNMPMAGMMPFGLFPGMMPHMPMQMGSQGVSNVQADPQANNGNRQQTPPLVTQPIPSQANYGSWNGMMSQYGLSNGYAQNHNGVPSTGEQVSGHATQPRQTSPPIMTPGMPMMPFLPTMPLIPQQYGNMGIGNHDSITSNQAFHGAGGNQPASSSYSQP